MKEQQKYIYRTINVGRSSDGIFFFLFIGKTEKKKRINYNQTRDRKCSQKGEKESKSLTACEAQIN